MSRMTLEELRSLRERKRTEMLRRQPPEGSARIVIGMGTCGIAAGAKESFDAFLDEIQKNGLDSVMVSQTGCMGLCYSEPTVEVEVPDMPSVVYGNVDQKTARRIVREHLVEGRLVDDHIYDKPAADILHQDKKDG